MAISPIGGGQSLWARVPTEEAADSGAAWVAQAAGRNGAPKAPPCPQEAADAVKVLKQLGRWQGVFGAPVVSELVLRVGQLDRALQQAKNNNWAKAKPGWPLDLGTFGPRFVNALMNEHVYGLKVDLVRASTRLDAAATRFLQVKPVLDARPDLLMTRVPLNTPEVAALKAHDELVAAAEKLKGVDRQIQSMIQQLSPKR